MDIPTQKERIALVTGSNTGIGEITARELARAGARVYLACRSTKKATEAMARIRTEVPDADLHFLEIDLGSFESIRRAAAEYREREDSLHMLINNAGLAGPKGVTTDGFELTFGVNHLGHFLLTLLLVDRVIESAPARIINVSSKGHYKAEGIDWQAQTEPTKSATGFSEYTVSKLANVLFTRELDRRLEGTGVSVYALHPGVVASDIWRKVPWPVRTVMKMFMISPEDGAQTTLHCATDPDAFEQSGLYWDECKPKKASKLALDDELAADLWRRSVEWTGVEDPFEGQDG